MSIFAAANKDQAKAAWASAELMTDHCGGAERAALRVRMKNLTARGWHLAAALFAALLFACGSSSSGSGGSQTASTGQGGVGGTTTSSSTTAVGGGCYGDPVAWKSLTTGPFACTKNADCCVVVNTCVNEAQVVAAKDRADAQEVWPFCGYMCADCLPPAVKVGCYQGFCAGVLVFGPDATPDMREDHCGTEATSVDGEGWLHFDCSA